MHNDFLASLISAEIKPQGIKSLEKLFQEAALEKRQLRVKLGIDPTSSDLHLGHMVCIQKLRQFQEAGHLPVLIIGSYTAQVGDPSGRNEARPALSPEEVSKHAQTYLDQVARVLDLTKTELHYNSDWFDKFTMADMLKLASRVTVNQMLAKDAFGNRLEAGQPLYMHETFYPVLQAYDSVQVRADIELGGHDQIFNLMVGRDLQKAYGQKPQLCITMPLLIGLDGHKKMSKTSANYIALNDSPAELFAKTMSISDEMILHYYELAARATSTELQLIAAQLAESDKYNPRDIKANLAKRLVEIYHGTEEGRLAEESFISQFKQNQIPENIPELSLSSLAEAELLELMLAAAFAPSRSEAKKLVAAGAVKLDGHKLSDPFMKLGPEEVSKVLQLGKRKFLRLLP